MILPGYNLPLRVFKFEKLDGSQYKPEYPGFGEAPCFVDIGHPEEGNFTASEGAGHRF